MATLALEDRAEIELPRIQRALALTTVIATATMQNGATFAVTTILPQMQGAMSATQDEISWTMTFNMLATAIMLPLVGWLVPRFGNRSVLLFASAGFTLATLLCGLAQSLEDLMLWRIAQGVAGAALIPLGQIVILEVFPQRQHAFALSLFGIANSAGPTLGPVAGGYLAEAYGWRWAFHMIVPMGVAAMVLVYFALPRTTPGHRPKLDWIGFTSLSVAVASLQYLLSRGERVDWFEAREIILSAWVCALSFYVFVVHSFTAAAPFIDLRMLADRNFSVGLVLIGIFGMIGFTPMVLLPTLMQGQMGYSDTDIGSVVSSRGIGILAGTVMGMVRLDERLTIAAGYSAQLVAALWMMQFSLATPLADLWVIAFLQGISVGLVWVPVSTITFRTMPAVRRPEAMAMFHLVRSVTLSFFIAASVAVVIRSTGINHGRLVEQISPLNKTLSVPSSIGAWDLESAAGLAAMAREVNRQAAMIGYINAFVLQAIVAAAALPLVLMIGRRPQR